MTGATAAMRMQGYRTRLTIIRAAAAPTAVVLRRGPKTHWRLSVWDLETDAFTHGQWMKGVIRLSSLSPNGRRLLYWAQQLHPGARWRRDPPNAGEEAGFDPLTRPGPSRLRRGRKVPRYMRSALSYAVSPIDGSWTAISRPPFFTALAIWPMHGRYGGGGWFIDDDTLWINEAAGLRSMRANTPPPARLRVLGPTGLDMSKWPVRDDGLDDATREARSAAWRAASAAFAPVSIDHAWPRTDGALDVAVDGRIMRVSEWRDRSSEAMCEDARVVADFNDMRFSLIPPSEAALSW